MMKTFLVALLLLISVQSSSGQTYCIERNFFTKGCITLENDSFLYENEGDFDNYQLRGQLKRIGDTLILNPNNQIDSLRIVSQTKIPSSNDSLEIHFKFSDGSSMISLTVWSEGFFGNKIWDGKLEIPASVKVSELLVTASYYLTNQLEITLEEGSSYEIVIDKPDTLYRYMESEERFLFKRRYLVSCNEEGLILPHSTFKRTKRN